MGRFKSQALADRLARTYRRPVGYSVYAFREEDSLPDGGRYPGLPSYRNSLLIGCADNAAARRAMAENLPGDPRRWLIDAGNDTNWGQVLIGNVADEVAWDGQAFAGETCHLLPASTVRCRNRREQGSAQAGAAEGETDQQQPETLRLF